MASRHGDLLVGRKRPRGEAAEAGRGEATEQALKDSKLGLSPEVEPTFLEDSKLDPTPEVGPTPLKKRLHSRPTTGSEVHSSGRLHVRPDTGSGAPLLWLTLA